jgi:hypothetical protein
MLEGDGEAVAFVGRVAAAGRPPGSDRLFSECQKRTRAHAGISADQPNPTHKRRRPWSDAPRSDVRSAVASRRIHPKLLLFPISKLLLTAPIPSGQMDTWACLAWRC